MIDLHHEDDRLRQMATVTSLNCKHHWRNAWGLAACEAIRAAAKAPSPASAACHLSVAKHCAVHACQSTFGGAGPRARLWSSFADEVCALEAAYRDQHGLVRDTDYWDRCPNDPRTSEGQAWLRSRAGLEWLRRNPWKGER